jgi:hypothetical protein
MKKWLRIIIIILTIGFFTLPTSSYACGTTTEKSCCKKETLSKSGKKECCCDKHSKNKKAPCDGKCGHSNCTTSSINLGILAFYAIEIKNNHFDFSSEKQNFYYSKINISAGFYSIWLIPKIG